jgi:hypothetical protein
MVKKSEMFDNKVINSLEVWCKECTGKLDDKGYGRQYHNLWELSWVKEDYFEQLETLIERMAGESVYKFSQQAVLDCLQLGRILYDKNIKVEDEEY